MTRIISAYDIISIYEVYFLFNTNISKSLMSRVSKSLETKILSAKKNSGHVLFGRYLP